MASDQLVHGPHGVDGPNGVHGSHGVDGIGRLDVTTAEVPMIERPGPSLLADDASTGSAPSDGAISISLETDELPFQQPTSRLPPVERGGRDWRTAVEDLGKWPLVTLGAAAVLVAVFAAFISRNGQSLSGDVDAPAAVSVEEPASASVAAPVGAEQLADVPSQAELDPSGRSTGTLGPGEGSGFSSGQVTEPDRALTDPDLDWTPTTVTPPTSATTPPTEPSSTTVAETTTLPPTTVDTAPPSSETTIPEPSGPWVRAVGPGSGDEQNPLAVSGRVTLEAEGSHGFMRYRFFVYARTDGGEWRQIERSRWRFDTRWTINTNAFDGRTVRWTVVGMTGFRDQTEESAPLYLVGG